jgi:hypothetical protein
MNKILYSALLVLLVTLGFNTVTTAQSICRPAIDCKFGTPNAVGWLMQGFFSDGSKAEWNFQPGAVFQENPDGTATLTGMINQYPPGTQRSFDVKVNFAYKTYGGVSMPEVTNCGPYNTAAWSAYTLVSGTLTGKAGFDNAGAVINLSQHMMPSQYGIGAGNQCGEETKLGLTGWFEWKVVSQPTNTSLLINTYPAYPVHGQADICININGTPAYCGGNICVDPIGNIKGGNGCIHVTGITTSCAYIQVFNSYWELVANIKATSTSVSIPNLPAGSYTVKVSELGVGCSWPVICEKQVVVIVTGNPCDNDITPPVIANCPTDQTKDATGRTGSCCNVYWTPPTATDNCCTPTLTSNYKPYDCFPVGKTVVIYTATDARGNKATCNFNVTVTKIVCNPVFDPNKCYKIVLHGNSNQCLGFSDKYRYGWEGANISLCNYSDNDDCKKWNIITSSNGNCKFRNSYYGKYMGSKSEGWWDNWMDKSICQYSSNDDYITDWKIICNSDGSYSIVHVASNYRCTNNNSNCTLGNGVSYDIIEVPCRAPVVCNPHNEYRGWKYLGTVDNKYYYKCTDGGEVDYDHAKKYCSYIGGRLPFVANQAENDFLKNNIGSSNCWLGMERKSQWDRNWKCSDNSEANETSWAWAWAPGQPNNYGGYEGCVEMYGNGSGKWNDCASWTTNLCICEMQCSDNQDAKSAQVFAADAQIESNRVRVDFSTNTGAEADYFNVKKLNATSGVFETLQIINNTVSDNSLQSHSAYDNAPVEGDNYYQIEIALNNGTKKLSDVQKVNFSSIKGLVLFPNPATDYIDVNLKDYKGKDVTIYLYNQIGITQSIHQIQNVNGASPEHIDLNNFSEGQYILRVESKGVRDAVKAIIIQK